MRRGLVESTLLIILMGIACKKGGVLGTTATTCGRLGSCCHEVATRIRVAEQSVRPGAPQDPKFEAECVSWTKPDPNNGGECGYGTDCWCGAMLEKFQSEYGVCK